MVHPIYDKEIYKYRVSRNKWIDYKWKANNCIVQCLSILNEENYREFVEAENMELFSIKENEVLRTNLGIKKIDFVFIFVGRIVSDKGINELIEAFDRFCLVEKDIKLLLVGPFEDKLDPLNKKN